MFKKTIFLCLAGVLVFSSLAAETPSRTNGSEFEMRASLTNNQTGERYELPVTAHTRNVGGNEFVTEYEIALAPFADTTEQSRSDSTHSATAYIFMSYSTSTSSDGLPCVKVNYYKGKWVRLDPAVTATQLKVQASVFAEPCANGNQIQKTETLTQNNPSNGTYYTKTPSWAGQFYIVNELGYHQAGKTIVTLKRGTTTWTFEVIIIKQ